MPTMSSKWNGPVLCLAGLVMLAVQVVAYLDVGLLSSWLIGGGIGLFLVGAASWFYYLDDRRSGARTAANDKFPTAEEFERDFHEVEPFDTRDEPPYESPNL